jgi:hypothetical protein
MAKDILEILSTLCRKELFPVAVTILTPYEDKLEG